MPPHNDSVSMQFFLETIIKKNSKSIGDKIAEDAGIKARPAAG